MIQPIILSLKISIIATLITSILGIATAYFFTKVRFRFKSIIETLILLPIALPPSVVGYGMLKFIGKNGLLGKFLYTHLDISLIFTWKAACIASIIVSLPLMYQNVKNSFEKIDIDVIDAARVYGATEAQVFIWIMGPIAIRGIMGGIILSFARSIGEFGATLIVAGNISGKTQTIPLAIYYAMERGDDIIANKLIIFVILLSFIMLHSVNGYLQRKD